MAKVNLSSLKNVGTKLSKLAGRPGLVVKKHSPEILLVGGIACIVGGAVWACKSTLELDDTIDDIKDRIDTVKNGNTDEVIEVTADIIEDPENKEMIKYEASRADLARVYIGATWDIVRLYAPSFILMGSGIGMVCGSHSIMHRRTASLMAAYELMDKSFEAYRQRVADKWGVEEEKSIRYAEHDEKIDVTYVDEKTGKEKKKKEIIKCTEVRPDDISIYARFFDDTCSEWDKSSEYNLAFLKGQQAWFNNLLQARGHVFLNEVYDALGIKRTQAGQVVGWIYDPDNDEIDNYVDFGIYNVNYSASRDFVNGYNDVILLDFNVDGVIYDLI